MAPEMFWNGTESPAGDVNSQGLVLYAACNGGKLPFMPEGTGFSPEDRSAAMRRRMSRDTPPLPKSAGSKLAEIIMKAMAFPIEDRWKDTNEMEQALSSYSPKRKKFPPSNPGTEAKGERAARLRAAGPVRRA
jgi:serine/threonine protein kinase